MFLDGPKTMQLWIRLEDLDTDMTETLSSLFEKTNGAPIEIDGRLAWPMFKTKISRARQNFLIRRLKANDSPIPGLRIKAVKGEVEVNDQRCSEIILWADTSPDSVVISVLSKSGCELKVWNVWRVDGITQAWIGNSGVVVTEADDLVTLECSDGLGKVDFSSLIVEMKKIG